MQKYYSRCEREGCPSAQATSPRSSPRSCRLCKGGLFAISRFSLFRTRFCSVPSGHRPVGAGGMRTRAAWKEPGDAPPGPAHPRPAPHWSSEGHRSAAVAWTPARTPLRRPLRRSAPPALPVPNLTDAVPGGSLDPRPGRARWAESEIGRGKREICTPQLDARRRWPVAGVPRPSPTSGPYSETTVPPTTPKSYYSFTTPFAPPGRASLPAGPHHLPPISPGVR